MGKKIPPDCCGPLNNIVKLEKDKFRVDANGCPAVAVCPTMPEGDANKCLYACNTYPDDAPGAVLGAEHCFLSYTVPADKELWAQQLIVAFNGTGQFLLKIAGVTVMRLITSPAQPTISIKLENAKPIAEAEVVEICFLGPCPGDYSATLIGTQFSI